VAAGLHRRGFRRGDVLAIYSCNTLEYPVIFHAVSLLGGINTTINPLYTAEEFGLSAQRRRRALPRHGAGFRRESQGSAHGAGITEIFVFASLRSRH